jgi:RNA methyltransferase, TrmH family
MILIGNESHGLKSELIDLSEEKISISKYGNAESLNASVATGIIMNAFREQLK